MSVWSLDWASNFIKGNFENYSRYFHKIVPILNNKCHRVKGTALNMANLCPM